MSEMPVASSMFCRLQLEVKRVVALTDALATEKNHIALVLLLETQFANFMMPDTLTY
jgi:hypothetical protein